MDRMPARPRSCRFSVKGAGASLRADGDAMLLVLTGEPIDEPVVGHGPFVMTSDTEIRQAIDDFNGGRFGRGCELKQGRALQRGRGTCPIEWE